MKCEAMNAHELKAWNTKKPFSTENNRFLVCSITVHRTAIETMDTFIRRRLVNKNQLVWQVPAIHPHPIL